MKQGMRITVTKGEEMGKKKSILIVDDNESMRRSLALILGGKGYDTETAGTGREAMEEAQRRFFNVVLLDIKLPDVEGIDLLAPLNSMHHDMAVIMITGHASIETAVRAMNKGASAYITKPLNMEEVLATVREALEKQRLIEEKRQADEQLARTVHDLKQTVAELRLANQKILEQQKSVIEEERLKVLLQMAGATAHELNQPLMALLGHIDLMERNQDNPEKLAHYMVEIKRAGERISDIVKKIQTLRHDETKPYIGETSIINLAQKIVILSLEASDEDFETLNVILEDHNQVNLTRAKGIEEAIRVLKEGQFDLIFFDYFLPDGTGFDFLRRMEKEGLEIPIVVITGQGDEMIAAQVIQAGAYDYLTKDRVSDESISRVIVSTLEKARLKRETKQVQKKMAEIFTRDDLTGLYNRRYFMEALEREVSRAKRYETGLVLCMMDLDYFKQINDTYGHPAGDMVLAEIGRMLKECIRHSDLVCRYGGEEFAVILPNTQPEKAHIMCERFRQMVAGHRFKYNSSRFNITVSVGIASYHDQPPVEFLKSADQALYQAKGAGRNKVATHGMSQRHRPKLGKVLVSKGYITEQELHRALSEQRLRLGELLVRSGRITAQQLNHALDYQKKVSMKLGEILEAMGYITAEDINRALKRMKRKLGEIMIEMGLLKDYKLQRGLALQEEYEPSRI